MSGSDMEISFNDQVNITFDWTVRNFSSLKGQTAPLQSNRIIVGNSAWNLRLYPLHPPDSNNDVVKGLENSATIFIVHSLLETARYEIRAHFDLSVKDGHGKGLLHKLSPEAGHLFTRKNNAVGYRYYVVLQPASIQGESSTLMSDDDLLKIRVQIRYSPMKQTEPDPLLKSQDRFRDLFESEVGKDFVLVSSDSTENHVHRAVLVAGSPVFSSMLQTDMEEAKTGRCEMSDVSTATMEALIRFVYCERTEDLTQSARTVLVAADKYQIDGLKKACELELVEKISNDTATELLLLADMVSASTLKAAALRHVAENLRIMDTSGQLKLLSEEATMTGDSTLIHDILSAVARWSLKDAS